MQSIQSKNLFYCRNTIYSQLTVLHTVDGCTNNCVHIFLPGGPERPIQSTAYLLRLWVSICIPENKP